MPCLDFGKHSKKRSFCIKVISLEAHKEIERNTEGLLTAVLTKTQRNMRKLGPIRDGVKVVLLNPSGEVLYGGNETESSAPRTGVGRSGRRGVSPDLSPPACPPDKKKSKLKSTGGSSAQIAVSIVIYCH